MMRFLLLITILISQLHAEIPTEALNVHISEFNKEVDSRKKEYISDLQVLFENYKKQGKLVEAIATRDHLRAFSKNGILSKLDIVEIPTELGLLQKSYMDNVNEIGNRIFGYAKSKVDEEVAILITKGELDKANSLKNDFQGILNSAGFTLDAKLALGWESLPTEITITENHIIRISILGQATSDLELNTGEVYQVRGISGNDAIILIGEEAASIPFDKTDLIARIAAKKKGIKYHFSPNTESMIKKPPKRKKYVFDVPSAPRGGWFRTGIIVKRGEQYTIRHLSGLWKPNIHWRGVDGNGHPLYLGGKGYPLPGSPEGALIGRVGSSRPFFIGNDGTTPQNTEGEIILTVNDAVTGYADNNGALRIVIESN